MLPFHWYPYTQVLFNPILYFHPARGLPIRDELLTSLIWSMSSTYISQWSNLTIPEIHKQLDMSSTYASHPNSCHPWSNYMHKHAECHLPIDHITSYHPWYTQTCSMSYTYIYITSLQLIPSLKYISMQNVINLHKYVPTCYISSTLTIPFLYKQACKQLDKIVLIGRKNNKTFLC